MMQENKDVCVKGRLKKGFILFVAWFSITVGEAKDVSFKQLLLSDFNEESLLKLSVMYGYARYFYPNPHLEKINWHFFLENHIRKIMALNNAQEVDSLLLKEFSVLIPELIFVSSELPSSETSHVADSFYVKENMLNTGYNHKTPISSKIKKINAVDTVLPVPGRTYSFPLYNALYACFPLALYELPSETPEIKQVIREGQVKMKNGFYASPYFRMANAMINHTIIQHFYAYYEENKLDLTWLNSFKTYLGQIADCASWQDYFEYTYLYYAHVKDGHILVMNGYGKPGSFLGKFIGRCCWFYYPDITVRNIEDKICIVDYASSYKNLNVGDEIVSVNGVPVEVLIEQKSKFISASTEASLVDKLCGSFLFQSFTKDSVLNLEIKRNDQLVGEIPVLTNKTLPRYPEQNDFIIQVEEDIWMIDFNAYKYGTYEAFVKYIDRFQKAKGLIIDLRNGPLPSILPILSHFVDSLATVGVILTPTYYYPNHLHVKYEINKDSKWGIYPATGTYKEEYGYEKPFPERIHTPVVFLTDARVFSFGETIMELVKHFKIGTIVGEHTAGTNGDAVSVFSPAVGYIFTGYKFFNHDGTQHYGIGTCPDVICPMKLDDLRNGVDTQVKKACEIIHGRSPVISP